MPTARELLEQADALMRRNRRRGKDKRGPSTLTDVLADRSAMLAPTVILPDAVRTEADPLVVAANADASDPITLETLSDVPVLTDVVDVWPGGKASPAPSVDVIPPQPGLDDALEADALTLADGDSKKSAGLNDTEGNEPDAVSAVAETPAAGASMHGVPVMPPTLAALDADTPTHAASVTASQALDTGTPTEIADSAAAVRHSSTTPVAPLEEEFILDIPPLDAEAQRSAERGGEVASPAVVPDVAAPEVRRGTPDWDAMAEEIRMQVLQRLDLLTDAGMRDRLGARLRPIVERAGVELVETINQELGELVRNCVAEAIEHEIDSWKKRAT